MADAQKYTNKLANARVLIIGGTSGIGFCVAEACLEAGCHVTISSSQPTRINSSISRLLTSYPSAKSRLTGHACDLASPDVEANIEALFSKLGTLDHIVFTAGDKLSTTPLSDVTLQNIHQFNQVRHFAPLLVAKHALAHFAPGPSSSFTLTTGTASERPVPGWINPAAFTAATHSTTRALALNMKPVRVNLISPGAVETELWDAMPRRRCRRLHLRKD
ncbi:hypothetical protein G7Y79_00002g006750 [Physcia stellaris]|nr:hypothetical protein G7Y79_00002g006750 [Physcia stellaris]